MGEQHLIMSFMSDFSREKFESLLLLVKEAVNKPNIPFLTQKRLYAVSVESLDNILENISNTKQDNLPINFSSKLFIIAEHEDGYSVKTGSYILNEQKCVLQNQIDKVNSLNKNQMQKFYLETLLKKSKPEGGGLGIIEMSLKTNNKIEYEFLPETDNISLLVVQTKMEKFA